LGLFEAKNRMRKVIFGDFGRNIEWVLKNYGRFFFVEKLNRCEFLGCFSGRGTKWGLKISDFW